jgi:hypothetical protein
LTKLFEAARLGALIPAIGWFDACQRVSSIQAWCARLTLFANTFSGFAGLMDPGLRRDDSFSINEGLAVTTAFATTTPVTPPKTGVSRVLDWG